LSPRLPRWLGGAGDASGLIAEPLQGWRAWQVVEGSSGPELRSWAMGTRWPARRALQSGCAVHGPRPAIHHSCGIHAFDRREEALAYIGRRDELSRWFVRHPDQALGIVLGRVSGWGKAIRHARGWRSQFAYPYDLHLLTSDLGLARALGDRYAVDAVALR
jgi:hypothetical protein